MAAMIFEVPPHWGTARWLSRTLVYESPPWRSPFGPAFAFKTAPGDFVSSRAQLMGSGAAGGGTSPWSAEGVLALTGTFGMMSRRSLALVRREHAMKADQMQPGTGNERG